MAAGRPELIFLTGPQAGQRVAPADNVLLVGRSAAADVRIAEQHASREQLRLTATRDGWLMENLSSNGTEVNGRRFRSARKKVLLATGDVLGVGLRTRILFVAPGDDPDEALAACRQQLPEASPEDAAPEPVPSEAPGAEPKTDALLPPEPPPADAPKTEKVVGEQAAEDSPASRRRKKLRKYGLLFVVYLGGVVALAAILSSLRQDGVEGPRGREGFLQPAEIAEVLKTVPRRSPNETLAASELRLALALYDNLPAREGDLYRCVRSFHLYLAHRRQPVFEDAQDERKYQRAMGELVDQVQTRYRNAWAMEQAAEWVASRNAYEQLLRTVPENDPDSEVYKQLVQNIVDHLTYVRGRAQKK